MCGNTIIFIFIIFSFNQSTDVNYDEPGILDEQYTIALKLVLVCDKIDNDEQNDYEVTQTFPYKPSILIFLPGIHEIQQMYKKLEAWEESNEVKWLKMPLHSGITSEEQQTVFNVPPENYRKIILSTNIAESSVTVPDIKYGNIYMVCLHYFYSYYIFIAVIDFCLTKNLVTDQNTGFTSLKLEYASKHNCIQRAGRAGRVMNGRVYRLVSRHYYEVLIQFNYSKVAINNRKYISSNSCRYRVLPKCLEHHSKTSF